ncbi:MAG: 50S ribosomal protein L18 [candidate division KSB1 bacterium]|nr:50S ribosomal protein L18 [candidate division KSB1 bacterium]MDZ7334652.1 50S ribosomal protein L18 [candidate division KSB1 bacterium]MDZ7357215.1 50S ribosomal protein L18 [candidate division KSB1 bacterium]MDZ7399467.1 50S ribosomal protein L18 [candidate division KSB1 bacterium]
MRLSRKQHDYARLRKKQHIRKRVFGTPERPRLVVYKSLKHTYAQLVDDVNQRTLTGVSTLTKELLPEVEQAKTKLKQAEVVGAGIAKKALALNVDKVVFDRNGYIYHGRVKAVADAARKGGLKF